MRNVRAVALAGRRGVHVDETGDGRRVAGVVTPDRVDQAVPVLRDLSRPSCALMPENPTPELPLPPGVPDVNQAKDSYACLQFDLDFGASANLFPGTDGTLLVGEMQKSGVYHVVRADTLAPVRKSLLGVACIVCNGTSTAYDPVSGALFGDVSPGTALFSIDSRAGSLRWLSVVGDPVHYQPLAVANGVVYTVDTKGFLDAYDANVGAPLLHRPLQLDGATDAAGWSSSGVAVANHTVYVTAGSHVLAYRPVATDR